MKWRAQDGSIESSRPDQRGSDFSFKAAGVNTPDTKATLWLSRHRRFETPSRIHKGEI